MRCKRALELSGKSADVVRLLQGMITADAAALTESSPFLASAFLTTKGRIAADCFLTRRSDQSMLIHAADELLPMIKRIVNMYKLRSPVQVHETDSNLVWRSSDNGVSLPDPRFAGLGFWQSLNGDDTIAELDSTRNDYATTRMLCGVAEGSEIVNEIPLECNLDFLNMISFSKGCYIGQELVARTKFKGIVRKRIVPFLTEHSVINGDAFHMFRKFDNIHDVFKETTVASDSLGRGSKVNLKGVEVGEVVAYSKGVGLAKLKLEHVLASNDQLLLGDTRIHPYIPSWWPEIDPVTGKSVFYGL